MSFKFRKNPIEILCLGAHCDDIEIGAGNTILRICKELEVDRVIWIVFTSNEIRKKEAYISAEKILESVPNKNILINSFRDGYLPVQREQIKDYFETIKLKFTPDLIVTHHRDDCHQDHRLISELTWNTWRNHLILEYEVLKYDGDLGTPNFYVPVNENIVAKRNKILIDSFQSQHSKHWFSDDNFRALLRIRGMESVTKYAEGFYARKVIF